MLVFAPNIEVVRGREVENGDVALPLHLDAQAIFDRPLLAQLENMQLAVLDVASTSPNISRQTGPDRDKDIAKQRDRQSWTEPDRDRVPPVQRQRQQLPEQEHEQEQEQQQHQQQQQQLLLLRPLPPLTTTTTSTTNYYNH